MIYFASDFHLGINARHTSEQRERQIIQWLDEIRDDADEIYLVGDMFDFWFEYRKVVPKGFFRLLGKLAELRDEGIPLHIFTGNHDMWMFDYLEEELDLKINRQPIEAEYNGKKFLIGHGDGLGPGDHGYKFIKRVFANKWCQRAFGLLPPFFGMSIAHYWSGKSRAQNRDVKEFLGAEKEWLVQYCESKLKERHFDYFIFGHRHLPIDYTLSNGESRYINLGEWMNFNSYAVFDGSDVQLRFYQNPEGQIYPVSGN
ncbi:MAG: UDP-2,3-diacylglucosamine diphosphatase [Saprospiraceae bacterium]|nr:UDP-2,3-diacylglucosamine diphosphatase [Saprospiraceae bacterium]